MEATGVYWLYLYEVLEAAGLEVVVVNGRHVQTCPDARPIWPDCQWLATLHPNGLLRGGFCAGGRHPAASGLSAAAQRSHHRRRRQAQKLQQTPVRMNVKLHDVICVSGLKMVRAILPGERRGNGAFRHPGENGSHTTVNGNFNANFIRV